MNKTAQTETSGPPTTGGKNIHFGMLLVVIVSLTTLWMLSGPNAAARGIVVHKTATCGCCNKWINHLQQAGFDVKAIDHGHDELAKLKTAHGVMTQQRSCHTAIVENYVIEGHVPADDIKRLLQEQPDVSGLVVPGMPVGSPGMEVEGIPQQPYQVLTFDRNGTVEVFASY
jgi:hypothetical protein